MKTQRVRIAVAMDENGIWQACGWSGAPDSHLRSEVVDNVASSASAVIHWVEADVPIPEPQTVEGMLVNDPSEAKPDAKPSSS